MSEEPTASIFKVPQKHSYLSVKLHIHIESKKTENSTAMRTKNNIYEFNLQIVDDSRCQQNSAC